MSWYKITSLDNVPLREGRSVRLGNKEIAIFHLADERVLAVDNRCPHDQGPLCDGITSGTTVVCPLHGWKVCLESGQVTKPDVPIKVRTYPARVIDGVIEIEAEATALLAEEVAA